MLPKKLLLKKFHVRFILHFALAAEGYKWEKAIILLYDFVRFHSSLWEITLT